MSDECFMYSPDPNRAYRHIDIVEYAKRGFIDGVLKCIRNGDDVNAKDYNDMTAVVAALQNNDLNMLRMLLDAGAKLCKFHGVSALGWAKNNKNQEMIDLITNIEKMNHKVFL